MPKRKKAADEAPARRLRRAVANDASDSDECQKADKPKSRKYRAVEGRGTSNLLDLQTLAQAGKIQIDKSNDSTPKDSKDQSGDILFQQTFEQYFKNALDVQPTDSKPVQQPAATSASSDDESKTVPISPAKPVSVTRGRGRGRGRGKTPSRAVPLPKAPAKRTAIVRTQQSAKHRERCDQRSEEQEAKRIQKENELQLENERQRKRRALQASVATNSTAAAPRVGAGNTSSGGNASTSSNHRPSVAPNPLKPTPAAAPAAAPTGNKLQTDMHFLSKKVRSAKRLDDMEFEAPIIHARAAPPVRLPRQGTKQTARGQQQREQEQREQQQREQEQGLLPSTPPLPMDLTDYGDLEALADNSPSEVDASVIVPVSDKQRVTFAVDQVCDAPAPKQPNHQAPPAAPSSSNSGTNIPTNNNGDSAAFALVWKELQALKQAMSAHQLSASQAPAPQVAAQPTRTQAQPRYHQQQQYSREAPPPPPSLSRAVPPPPHVSSYHSSNSNIQNLSFSSPHPHTQPPPPIPPPPRYHPAAGAAPLHIAPFLSSSSSSSSSLPEPGQTYRAQGPNRQRYFPLQQEPSPSGHGHYDDQYPQTRPVLYAARGSVPYADGRCYRLEDDRMASSDASPGITRRPVFAAVPATLSLAWSRPPRLLDGYKREVRFSASTEVKSVITEQERLTLLQANVPSVQYAERDDIPTNPTAPVLIEGEEESNDVKRIPLNKVSSHLIETVCVPPIAPVNHTATLFNFFESSGL